MIDFDFLVFGDQTALAAANRRADKLSFLGEKLLRVYFPEPDRTRRGRPPVFAVESRINLWQRAEFMSLEVTGDDLRDLIVGYWKGLKKDRVVLDVYARTEDGGFEESPRTTALDIKKGDRGFIGYGHDLTGDGLFDLVVVSQKNVLIFPGQAKPGDGSDLVASKPLFAPPKEDSGSGEVEIYVGSRGSGSSPSGSSPDRGSRTWTATGARSLFSPGRTTKATRFSPSFAWTDPVQARSFFRSPGRAKAARWMSRL